MRIHHTIAYNVKKKTIQDILDLCIDTEDISMVVNGLAAMLAQIEADHLVKKFESHKTKTVGLG